MSKKELKDLNSGTLWGRIASAIRKKSDGGKPYIFITLECGNEFLGNVQTYVRLWGEERVEKFLDYYKQHPHDAYRFFCFFNQYEDDGRTLSNYTAYKWVPYQGSELKATFILRGKITGGDLSADEPYLNLYLKREGDEGYEPAEEKFLVYLHPKMVFVKGASREDLKEGAHVEIAGYLRAKEPEDSFGRQSSDIRPYVMEMIVYPPF